MKQCLLLMHQEAAVLRNIIIVHEVLYSLPSLQFGQPSSFSL